MTEYKATAEELHSLWAGLPERMLLHDLHFPDQIVRLNDWTAGFFRMAVEHLDPDVAALQEVVDDVDDARYPNWSLLPPDFRNRVAQLVALFEDTEQFVPAERLRSGQSFEALLTRTREIFHEARILLHGSAQRLCLALEWLQDQKKELEESDVDEISDVAARTFYTLTGDLQTTPALYEVRDRKKHDSAWDKAPNGTRNDVETIRELCLNPPRFVPERNLDQVEDSLGWAYGEWRGLLERLGMPR